MSFGKMNTVIEIIDTTFANDEEGFASKSEQVIVSAKAYKDERHGSRKWANMAAYTKANATFQMRNLPNLVIHPGMLIRCDTGTYKILSVEIIRQFYLEIAAEKMEAIKD